jgi:hypothetical protein
MSVHLVLDESERRYRCIRVQTQRRRRSAWTDDVDVVFYRRAHMSQARGVAPTQEAVPARKVQGVITAVKAEGVLKTVAVDTVTGSSTGGHSWTRRVAGSEKSFWAGESSRTVQEVTPRVTMSAAPETVAGAKGNFGGDATSTTERVAPISKRFRWPTRLMDRRRMPMCPRRGDLSQYGAGRSCPRSYPLQCCRRPTACTRKSG